MVTKTIIPNQMLKLTEKYTTAMTMSTMVGRMEKTRYERSELMEFVPLSMTLRTSPVFLVRCQRRLSA